MSSPGIHHLFVAARFENVDESFAKESQGPCEGCETVRTFCDFIVAFKANYPPVLHCVCAPAALRVCGHTSTSSPVNHWGNLFSSQLKPIQLQEASSLVKHKDLQLAACMLSSSKHQPVPLLNNINDEMHEHRSSVHPSTDTLSILKRFETKYISIFLRSLNVL